ncbi:MAG: APC family permease [Terriglobales bacterium]
MSAPRRLRLVPLIAATFFMVSGGPYGLEDLVQKAGYARALLVLAVVPLIWSLPTALMVGELSSAIPEEGGYYEWVRRAMGPFWGFQEAWLSLVASIFDMAIYPTLFILYFGQLVPAAARGHWYVVTGVLVVVVAAVWNIAGIRAVGDGSTVLMLLILAPFAVLVVVGLSHPGKISQGGPPGHWNLDMLGALSVAMWNYMGWDNASTVAGEVENPQKNYPRAMLICAALVAFTYLAPVAAAALAGIDPSAWSTGAWAQVAGELAGRWLEIAVVAGGMICGVGMTTALVLSYTRVPYAMAMDGMLPKVLTRVHPKTGAPWVAIVVCATAWCLCLPLGFEKLILIDIMLYGGSLMLEFVALVVLRVREPEMPRPFRVPGGTFGAAMLAVGPAALIAVAIVRSYGEQAGPMNALGFGAGIVVAGVVAYLAFMRKKQPAADQRR